MPPGTLGLSPNGVGTGPIVQFFPQIRAAFAGISKGVTQSVVLTLVGPDKPGLVEAVSEVIATHGGNWLESRMAHLAGQFAGILRVEVPEMNVDAMRQALARLSASDLQITVVAAVGSPKEFGLRPLRLHLVGQDRPGIVREIAQVLASHGVNVEELQTECQGAPMSGEVLFVATAKLGVPDSLKQEVLRGALERIASDLMVDITLESPSKPVAG